MLTISAANKIQELIKEDGNLNLKLRVYITGGGCSGFQYGFNFEEEVKADDQIVDGKCDDEEDGQGSGTVQLLIDPMSFMYLSGSEIDYTADIQGERFIIRNPNAKTTCGCGSSFSV